MTEDNKKQIIKNQDKKDVGKEKHSKLKSENFSTTNLKKDDLTVAKKVTHKTVDNISSSNTTKLNKSVSEITNNKTTEKENDESDSLNEADFKKAFKIDQELKKKEQEKKRIL